MTRYAESTLREVTPDYPSTSQTILDNKHGGYKVCNAMSVAHGLINVRNLRLRTFIGFNPEEKTKRQDIVVNIEIDYAFDQDVLDDKVQAALNYKTITKEVINHVESGRFMLLEKLVADVLSICSNHPQINYARVTVDKPHALRFADSVSLTLEHRANKSTSDAVRGGN